ncbi:MAG: DEAD/DEAH box helicase [Planctomycetota bacterium JB042]
MSDSKKNLRPSADGFAAFDLGAKLHRGLADAGFTTPRRIQVETIPAALEGRDVLGLAQTGTGKTAAFALPILRYLASTTAPRDSGPRALVVAPTRELVAQIDAEIRRLGRHTHLRSVTIIGGVNQNRQVRALREGADIVVACPGRLLDLYQQRHVDFDDVEILVLDEADHMFDMGFLPDIRRLLRALPEERQNLLFSATMPPEIRSLADGLLHRPHVVELEHSAPPKTIEHALVPVAPDAKAKLLRHFLDHEEYDSAIVFTRTKHRAKRLAQQLDRDGHHAVALQGNMSQPQRDRAMNGFREGKYDVLVATDIAARGIDVAQVSLVVNFDVPMTPDAYTHRIGRTGRSEGAGRAVTFVTRDDDEQVRAIEKKLAAKIRVERIAGFDDREAGRPSPAPRGGRSGGGARKSAHGRQNRRRGVARSRR